MLVIVIKVYTSKVVGILINTLNAIYLSTFTRH